MVFRILIVAFCSATLSGFSQVRYNTENYKNYVNTDFGKQLAFFSNTCRSADSTLTSDEQKFEYFSKAGEVLSQSVWTNLGFEQFKKALIYTNNDHDKIKINRILALLAIDHEELKIAQKHVSTAKNILKSINNDKEELKTLITEASLISAKKANNPLSETNYDSLLSLKLNEVLEIEQIEFNDFESNVLIHQIVNIRTSHNLPSLLERSEAKISTMDKGNHRDLIVLLNANLHMAQYKLDMIFVSEFIIKKILAEGGEDLIHMIASYSKKYNAEYENSDSIVHRFYSADDYRVSIEVYDNLLRDNKRKVVWSDLALAQGNALYKNREYLSSVIGKLDTYIAIYELMHEENSGSTKVATALLIAQLAAQLVSEVKGMDQKAYLRMVSDHDEFVKLGELFIKTSQSYLLKSGQQYENLKLNNYNSILTTFNEEFFKNEYSNMVKYDKDSLLIYSNSPIILNSFRGFYESYLKMNYEYYLYTTEGNYKNLLPYVLYDQYIDIIAQSSLEEKDKFELTEDAFEIRNIATRISLANDILEGFRLSHKVKDGERFPYLDYALYFMEKTKASSLQSELFIKSNAADNEKEDLKSIVVQSTQELRNKIPVNTAILQYSIDGNNMIRMTATKEFVKFDTYNLRKDSIDYLVSGFRNSIKFKLDETYKYTAWRLGKKLIPNLKNNITSIVVVPDQELNQLPFEALLYKKGKKKYNDFSSLPYLVNKYEISYSYSSTMYINNQKRNEKNNSILAMAPVFSKGNSNQSFSLSTDLVRSSTMDLSSIQALPFTSTEITNIKTIAEKNGSTAKVLENSLANKTNFLSSVLKQYDVIHIASHAFSDEKDYENSGILFYFDETGNASKAILSVNEVKTLNLNTSLVCLSACETGLGKIVKGEGVFGLGRSFFIAGVHNLLASYWKVSDASTNQLITSFYINTLSYKYTYSKALQISKQNMIQGKIYSHPYYWSPFVLIKG